MDEANNLIEWDALQGFCSPRTNRGRIRIASHDIAEQDRTVGVPIKPSSIFSQFEWLAALISASFELLQGLGCGGVCVDFLAQEGIVARTQEPRVRLHCWV